MTYRLILFLPSLLLLMGCASNRANTILSSVATGLITGTIGALTAPSTDNPAGHAALWSGVGASTGAIAGLFVFDEQKRTETLEKENLTLKRALSSIDGSNGNSELLYETHPPLGKELPEGYRNLIRPGSWSIYRLDQWVPQGDNVIVHQDKMVKLLPPELNPKPQAVAKQGEQTNENK